jgi:hypothetical protein
MAFRKNRGMASNLLSKRDPGQVMQDAHNMDEFALDVIAANSLVPKRYSKITWDYQVLLDGTEEIKYLYFWGFGEKESNQLEVYDKPLGAKEKTTINLAGYSPVHLAGKYFYIYDSVGSIAAWFNLDGGNVAPSVVVNRFLEIPITTGSNPSQLALAIKTTFNADSEFTAVNSSTYVMIESTTIGNKNDALNGDTTFNFLIEDGVATLNSKYLLLSDETSTLYYIWFNENGTGVDPLVPLATAIEVPLGIAETAFTVAQKIVLSLSTYPKFKTSQEGVYVVIENVYDGICSGLVDGNTGFVLNKIQLGEDKPLVGKLEVILDVNDCPAGFERII